MALELEEKIIGLAKQEMVARDWCQRELADAMKVSESEISLLLNRKRKWSLHNIEALHRATGVKIEL